MPDGEKLYLACDECGEVFDEMKPAVQHAVEAENWKCKDALYSVIPESEAF